MKIVRFPGFTILGLVLLLTLQACGEDPPAEDLSIPFQRTENTHTNLVLYTPPEFDVNPIFQDGVSGFSIENEAREFMGVVARTTASRLSVSSQAGQDVTAPAFAQAALGQLLTRVRRHVPKALGSSAVEGLDWRITTFQSGVSQDRLGQPVAFGHYALQYKPAFQLRSSRMALYLSTELLGVTWESFPRNPDAYYPAGNNIVEFILAITLLDIESFYSAEASASQTQVNFAYAVIPRTRTSREVLDTITDTLSFKTLGGIRDHFAEATTTFTVGSRGPAVDILLAVDEADSMYGEGNVLQHELPRILTRLNEETDVDYRLGLITSVSSELVRFPDGRLYLSRESNTAAEQLTEALAGVWTPVPNVDTYRPRNELLRHSAAWAAEADERMRRPHAPLVLMTLSDRDDASRSMNGNHLSSSAESAEYFTEHLRPYSAWMAVFAMAANCWTLDRDTSVETGSNFSRTARMFGGVTFDLCRASPQMYVAGVVESVARHGARFQFAAPQPLPFTLVVSLNGRVLPKSRATGWYYHVIDDRIALSSSVTVNEDDVLTASYKRLTPPE